MEKSRNCQMKRQIYKSQELQTLCHSILSAVTMMWHSQLSAMLTFSQELTSSLFRHVLSYFWDQLVMLLIPFCWQMHVVSSDDFISSRQWGCIRNSISQPLFFWISRIETNKCRGSLSPISPQNIFQIIWRHSKTWKNTQTKTYRRRSGPKDISSLGPLKIAKLSLQLPLAE